MLDSDILITGGTGYLGRALARALLDQTKARRICIFSRGEFAQAQMRQAIPDPDERLRWFIGDVRDGDRLRRAMQHIELVIHTAALKRVEVGEYNPDEMVRTNVVGAMNVIDAARDTRVAKVVAVSTDKACAPLNAYGATKLTMEKLMLAANNTTGPYGPKFSVVRYGNVSGSTGSVIPTWRLMKAAGLTKVPVTDPRCSRFWMKIEEAVELILWTAANMEGGETVVPLLPAYKIGTLAEAMGMEMDIKGIGAGEKLDEAMIAPLESPEFRYCPPYLVRGGLAARVENNVGGIKLHLLDVDELRAMLEDIPA
jgi:UDP-N-acetylglucosamine 4,6-dehydratase